MPTCTDELSAGQILFWNQTPQLALTFVSWGAIMWLPDIRRWAKIAASFLKPGGGLYLADAHPAALVFDDASPGNAERF
jgi:hypothetical protein